MSKDVDACISAIPDPDKRAALQALRAQSRA